MKRTKNTLIIYKYLTTQVAREKKRRTREVKQEEVVLEIVEEDIINDRHKLSMKHSPSLFSEMIKNLSSAQRQWISETGFGSILDFELHTYPKYLSYGVVTKFDYESCRFVIDGRSIEISDVDVHRVLGLPLGLKTIPFVKSETPAKEWRKQYGTSKNAFRVSVKDVAIAVENSMLADFNFKQNFISLLIGFFCQAPSNSYIRQKLLGFCCDLDCCYNYNWCEFVIKCLKKSTKFWLKNKETRYYTGSLPFLLV